MSECRSVPIPVHADAVVSLLVWSKACSWSKRRSVGAKPNLLEYLVSLLNYIPFFFFGFVGLFPSSEGLRCFGVLAIPRRKTVQDGSPCVLSMVGG